VLGQGLKMDGEEMWALPKMGKKPPNLEKL